MPEVGTVEALMQEPGELWSSIVAGQVARELLEPDPTVETRGVVEMDWLVAVGARARPTTETRTRWWFIAE
jgi:hypothetical protein